MRKHTKREKNMYTNRKKLINFKLFSTVTFFFHLIILAELELQVFFFFLPYSFNHYLYKTI